MKTLVITLFSTLFIISINVFAEDGTHTSADAPVNISAAGSARPESPLHFGLAMSREGRADEMAHVVKSPEVLGKIKEIFWAGDMDSHRVDSIEFLSSNQGTDQYRVESGYYTIKVSSTPVFNPGSAPSYKLAILDVQKGMEITPVKTTGGGLLPTREWFARDMAQVIKNPKVLQKIKDFFWLGNKSAKYVDSINLVTINGGGAEYLVKSGNCTINASSTTVLHPPSAPSSEIKVEEPVCH